MTFSWLWLFFLFGFTIAFDAPIQAQATSQTPQQIQGLIANGQEAAALSELNQIIAANPSSGVAWYLIAEAQDASGNDGAARYALARAKQLTPGLPFANPGDVVALQTHLSISPQNNYQRGFGNGEGLLERIMATLGISAGLFVVVVLFLYFVPSIVALSKGATTTTIVILLNVFLGWTILGWFAALLIALFSQTKRQIELQEARIQQVRR